MASTMTSPQIAAAIQAGLAGGAAPAPSTSNVNHSAALTPAVGGSAGQVNKIYSAAFTVTTGTPLSIDLTALTDPLGAALNFTNVAAILISNDSVVAGQDFSVGGGTNGLFTAAPNIIAANGGMYLLANPNPGITVDGTHKIITITVAAGTGVGGKITVLGH
jgi:hypothetical protein